MMQMIVVVINFVVFIRHATSERNVVMTESYSVIGCPEGSYPDTHHQKCLTRHLIPANYRCPFGYMMKYPLPTDHASSIICEKTDQISPFYECYKGHLKDNSICEQEIAFDPIQTCSKGYYLEDVSCVQRQRVPANTTCPYGTVPSYMNSSGYPKSCHHILIQPILFDCPKGYIVDTEQHICRSEERVEPDKICHKGWKLNDSVDSLCTREIETNAEFTCPPGFDPTLKNGKQDICIMKEQVHPVLQCKKDFKLDTGGTYQHQLFGQESFNPGKTSDQLCLSIIKELPSIYCPKGYRPNGDNGFGQCSKRIELEPQRRCPDNTLQDGKKCVTFQSVPPTYKCPKDYTQVIKDGVTPVCEKSETKPVEKKCPKGYILEQNVCTKLISEKSKLVCVEGQLIKGKQCEIISVVPPIPDCSHFNNEEQLYHQHTSYSDQMFPQSHDRRHLHTSIDPYQYTANNPYVMYTFPDMYHNPHDLNNNGILSTFQHYPISNTAHHHTVSHSSSFVNECYQRSVKPSTLFCPKGFKLHDTNCIGMQVLKPENYCLKGILTDHHKCELDIITQSVRVCPKGFSLGATHCERTEIQENRLLCPEGYKDNGFTCFKTRRHKYV